MKQTLFAVSLKSSGLRFNLNYCPSLILFAELQLLIQTQNLRFSLFGFKNADEANTQEEFIYAMGNCY